MRSIGTIHNEKQADLFKTFLLAQEISCDLEPTRSGEFEIWIHNENVLDTAASFLESFRSNPDAPEFVEAHEKAAQRAAEEEEAQRRFEQNMIDVGRAHRRGRLGNCPLTFLLIGISAFVFANAFYFHFIPALNQLLYFLPLDQINVYRYLPPATEFYRTLTPIFLHFGIAHILFNMMWLHDFGVQIESRRGTLYFLLLVIVIGVASNFGQNFFSHPKFGGMSGVNYGLFGYIWMRSRFDPASGFFIDKTNVIILVGWFIFCIVGPHSLHVANAAHAVGLGLGIVWGLIDTRRLGAKPR